MYNSDLENQLILVDIIDAMQDYVSLQGDIDETRVKSAEIMAQRLDLQRIIGAENVARCLEDDDNFSQELKDMIVPPLCYYTYSRLLKNFQGTYTDSGFSTEQEAEDRNTAKAVANEMSSVAETFMDDILDWLAEENPAESDTILLQKEKLTPRVRTIGGEEWRASN